MAERATFAVGDAAQASLTRHDWVVIDRVICCYEHVGPLLDNAISAAAERIAFTVPVSSGWRGLALRVLVTLENNVLDRFRKRPCPTYAHDVRKIEARLDAAGFSRLRSTRVGLWYLAVWDRPAA